MKQRVHAPLEVGDRVEFEPGSPWRVVRTTECSATIAEESPEMTEPVAFEARDGKRVSFNARLTGRRIEISRNSPAAKQV